MKKLLCISSGLKNNIALYNISIHHITCFFNFTDNTHYYHVARVTDQLQSTFMVSLHS